MTRDVVVGLDLGTTSAKVVVRDLGGAQLALVSEHTPWTSVPREGTETPPYALLDLSLRLLRRSVEEAAAAWGPVRAVGVGVAGLAESGVLLDSSGEPCAPVIAWFDRRGSEQMDRLDARLPELSEQFARRTGLPWDCQASIAKLLWLRDAGTVFSAGHRWLSVPEWLVHRLGGDLVREPSLASRTGLIDQATGQVWAEVVAAAGLPATLLPASRPAGEPSGVLTQPDLPSALQGAVLTVAGHDHPVAAIGVGAVGDDELFNSTGTADVLARSIPGGLTDDQRERLVSAGLSAGAHVLAGTTLVLGGARGGLLLRRLLEALGAGDQPVRDLLDQAALAVGDLPAGLAVSGAGPTGDDVVIRLRDEATPPALWAAAARYTADQTLALVRAIEGVVGPHRRAVACGGWTRMASIRAAKSAAVHDLTFSSLPEPGVVGAAVLAAQAAGVAGPVVTTAAAATAPPVHTTSPTHPEHKELA